MATDLLIITPGFPANEQDSTCIPPLQVYLLALREQRPELRIAVITTQYPATTRTYAWHGINVHPCGGGNALWKKPLVWWRARRTFDRVMKTGAIGAIHSLWLGEAAMLGERFAKRCGARHVLTLMGQDARDGSRWWQRLATKPVTVCVSERQSGAFRSMAGSTADAIIPWGIDEASRMPPTERTTDLLFVGSMTEVKRPKEFMRLYMEIRKQRAVQAVMIGRTRDHRPAAPIEHYGLTTQASHLDLYGEMARKDVLAHMARSKVLVHTSAFESQGFVFDEALINGMSIVSYPVGSAQPSDRWRMVHTNDELLAAVNALLDQPVGTTPLIQRPVKNTVRAYLRSYGLE